MSPPCSIKALIAISKLYVRVGAEYLQLPVTRTDRESPLTHGVQAMSGSLSRAELSVVHTYVFLYGKIFFFIQRDEVLHLQPGFLDG